MKAVGVRNLAMLGAALHACTASAATTIDTLPAGRFAIEREHFVYDGPPMLHGETEWRKNRLVWTSADGRVRFFLEDTGGTLSSDYQVQQADRGVVCLGGGSQHAYQSRQLPERRWRGEFRSKFTQLLRFCEAWIDKPQREAYRAEFAEASAEFGSALEVLKQAAVEDFGGWERRCLKLKRSDIVMSSGMPVMDCVRTSGD